MSVDKKDGVLKIELLEDIATVEVGRVMSDLHYGNYRLSIRISTRTNLLDEVIDELKAYVDKKVDLWTLGRR